MQATTKPLARRVQAEKEILSIAHHFPRPPIPIEIQPHVRTAIAAGPADALRTILANPTKAAEYAQSALDMGTA